ncbi:hypothetical protein B0H14DRAFT_3883718 [Mycena olivaceomarginata]|nr:hypothetical protein B0H14DRAFT_3883718 [Mycena olivaceomarginata]
MKSTIDNTYGALFLSIVVSSVLYGVGVLQFWIYIRKYHAKDPLILTSLVSAVLIFDTFQLAFLCHGISSISDPEIYISVVNVQLKFLFQVIELEPLSITSMTLTAVTDVAISVSMVFLLQASKTGYKRTTDLINRLMIFTFNTGLPTAISAILCTVTIILWPNTFLFIFFFLLLAHLYTNSLLVTLNSRDYIKAANDDLEQYSLESSTLAARRASRPISKLTMAQDSSSDNIAIPIDKGLRLTAEYSEPRVDAAMEVFLTQYPSYIDPYDYPIRATTSVNNIVNKYEPERCVPPSPPTYASPLCLEHRQRRTSLVDHTGRMPIEDLGPGPSTPVPCAASTVAYAHPGAGAPPTACATPCQSRPAALPPDHTPDSYLNDAAHWPTPTASSIPTTEAHPSASLSLSQSHLPLVRHLPLHPPPHAPMPRPRAHDVPRGHQQRRGCSGSSCAYGCTRANGKRGNGDAPLPFSFHVPAALPPILAAPPMRASPLAVFAGATCVRCASPPVCPHPGVAYSHPSVRHTFAHWCLVRSAPHPAPPPQAAPPAALPVCDSSLLLPLAVLAVPRAPSRDRSSASPLCSGHHTLAHLAVTTLSTTAPGCRCGLHSLPYAVLSQLPLLPTRAVRARGTARSVPPPAHLHPRSFTRVPALQRAPYTGAPGPRAADYARGTARKPA